jgi:hypothetical protein
MQRKFQPKMKPQRRKTKTRFEISRATLREAVETYLERGGTIHIITRAELSRRSLASILSARDEPNPGIFDHTILNGTKCNL